MKKIPKQEYTAEFKALAVKAGKRQGEFVLPRIILETKGLTGQAGHRQTIPV
jgi:hypothetical protein